LNFNSLVESIIYDRLTHTERDIASKRTLIENYKSKLNELEVNGTRPSDKSMSEVK
jgi:hypothetical protein